MGRYSTSLKNCSELNNPLHVINVTNISHDFPTLDLKNVTRSRTQRTGSDFRICGCLEYLCCGCGQYRNARGRRERSRDRIECKNKLPGPGIRPGKSFQERWSFCGRRPGCLRRQAALNDRQAYLFVPIQRQPGGGRSHPAAS